MAAARSVLDGDSEIPAPRRARAAAVLARNALELAVDLALAGSGIAIADAGMRVKLICLTVVDPSMTEAEIAWVGLSNACHQHAYELSPTTLEVERLIDGVARVLEAA